MVGPKSRVQQQRGPKGQQKGKPYCTVRLSIVECWVDPDLAVITIA
jgi:hypothetical protein